MNEPASGSSYRSSPTLKRSRAQLAAFMKRRREHLELPMAHVARELGVSAKTYREWEAGTRSIQVEYLPSIAVILCVSVQDVTSELVDRVSVSQRSFAASVAA